MKTNRQINADITQQLETLLLQLETQLANADIYNDVPEDVVVETKQLRDSVLATLNRYYDTWQNNEVYCEKHGRDYDEPLIPRYSVILGIAVALKKQREKELHPEIAQCKIDDYSIIDEQ
jgi:hypothetical protein